MMYYCIYVHFSKNMFFLDNLATMLTKYPLFHYVLLALEPKHTRLRRNWGYLIIAGHCGWTPSVHFSSANVTKPWFS